jgi:excisionase family DNA binding protein
MSERNERTLFGFQEIADRWGVSAWTVRRAVDRGDLRSINIGARRCVSLQEVVKAELTGIGTPRARKRATAVQVIQH